MNLLIFYALFFTFESMLEIKQQFVTVLHKVKNCDFYYWTVVKPDFLQMFEIDDLRFDEKAYVK